VIFSLFGKRSSPGQVKHVTVINRLCTFVLATNETVHGTYGNLWNRLYGFVTGYSVYQIGHPLIDNCGDAKMRWLSD
jgi:hypothetical protein